MSFLTRRFTIRPLTRSTTILSTSLSTRRTYADSKPSKSSSETQGEGITGKGDKNARPVILEHSPPSDPKDPEVKKHNEEFEKRPDRASNMIDDKNEPAVNKEFWKGQGGVDKEA